MTATSAAITEKKDRWASAHESYQAKACDVNPVPRREGEYIAKIAQDILKSSVFGDDARS